MPNPQGGRRVSAWGRALTFGGLCACLVLVASSDGLHALFLRLLDAAEGVISRHPFSGALLFVLLAALSAMLAFFSSAPIVPVAVYSWGEAASTLLLWVGWTLGGISAYFVSRFLGRPVVGALTSDHGFTRITERISARTPFGLVFLFQLALPSEVPGWVLGLVGYPFGRYLLALALVELPWAAGTVYLSTGLLERRIPLLVSIAAAGALFSGWALYTLQKRLATR